MKANQRSLANSLLPQHYHSPNQRSGCVEKSQKTGELTQATHKFVLCPLELVLPFHPHPELKQVKPHLSFLLRCSFIKNHLLVVLVWCDIVTQQSE